MSIKIFELLYVRTVIEGVLITQVPTGSFDLIFACAYIVAIEQYFGKVARMFPTCDVRKTGVVTTLVHKLLLYVRTVTEGVVITLVPTVSFSDHLARMFPTCYVWKTGVVTTLVPTICLS